jgi:predicted N-acetyltransferase YhbS
VIEVAHLDAWTPEARNELYDGEARPFGGRLDHLGWRAKELHTVGRLDGRIVSHVGLTVALADVAGTPFAVVGVGGVIVSHAQRGRGRLRPVFAAALERAGALGPDRALLFCAERRVAMYARFGFHRVAGPVTIGRPGGGTWVFPEVTMWRALRAGIEWPAGAVRLHGLPF